MITTTTTNLHKIINEDKPVLKVKSAQFGYNVDHFFFAITARLQCKDA